MVDCERIETLFMKNLDLRQRPVAVSFLDSAPPLVEKFEGVRPSGCSFWKLASDGRIFYTVGADHFNFELARVVPRRPRQQPCAVVVRREAGVHVALDRSAVLVAKLLDRHRLAHQSGQVAGRCAPDLVE